MNRKERNARRQLRKARNATQAEWEARRIEAESASAAAALRRPAEPDDDESPMTPWERLWAFAIGTVMVAIGAWPSFLAFWLMTGQRYVDLSATAVSLRFSAWVFWLLLALLAAAAALFFSRVKLAAMGAIAVAFVISMFFGAMGMLFMTQDDGTQSRINLFRSDYQYTMRVQVIPSDYDYYAEYRTPHRLVPVIGYHSTRAQSSLPDPCVDVYLGMLGGYWADAPYTCAPRPGLRMAGAADLSPVVQRRWGWRNELP